MQFYLFVSLVSSTSVHELVGRIAALGYKVGPASSGGDLFTTGDENSFGVLAALDIQPSMTTTKERVEKKDDPQSEVLTDLKKVLKAKPTILYFSAVVVHPNANPAKSLTWTGGNVIPEKEETKEEKKDEQKAS